MEKTKVYLFREQTIDEDTSNESQKLNAYFASDNLRVYENEENDLVFTLLVEGETILLKIIRDDYQAYIPLRIEQMTSGQYVFGDKTLQFEFILHKIVCKGLEIYMEYDIFSKQSVISNNTWKIEVI